MVGKINRREALKLAGGALAGSVFQPDQASAFADQQPVKGKSSVIGQPEAAIERRQACPACGSLNATEETSCNYCGRENLLLVDIASNMRQRRRSGR